MHDINLKSTQHDNIQLNDNCQITLGLMKLRKITFSITILRKITLSTAIDRIINYIPVFGLMTLSKITK